MALVPSALVSAGPLSCDLLNWQVTEHGPHARVVTVTGEIDALTAPKLGALLTAQLAATAVLVIDLARVRFLGSAGLSALFAANEFAIRENRYLWLVFPHRGIVNRALEVTGLSEQFNIAETVVAALINSL